jgi:hypothetical protein
VNPCITGLLVESCSHDIVHALIVLDDDDEDDDDGSDTEFDITSPAADAPDEDDD